MPRREDFENMISAIKRNDATKASQILMQYAGNPKEQIELLLHPCVQGKNVLLYAMENSQEIFEEFMCFLQNMPKLEDDDLSYLIVKIMVTLTNILLYGKKETKETAEKIAKSIIQNKNIPDLAKVSLIKNICTIKYTLYPAINCNQLSNEDLEKLIKNLTAEIGENSDDIMIDSILYDILQRHISYLDQEVINYLFKLFANNDYIENYRKQKGESLGVVVIKKAAEAFMQPLCNKNSPYLLWHNSNRQNPVNKIIESLEENGEFSKNDTSVEKIVKTMDELLQYAANKQEIKTNSNEQNLANDVYTPYLTDFLISMLQFLKKIIEKGAKYDIEKISLIDPLSQNTSLFDFIANIKKKRNFIEYARRLYEAIGDLILALGKTLQSNNHFFNFYTKEVFLQHALGSYKQIPLLFPENTKERRLEELIFEFKKFIIWIWQGNNDNNEINNEELLACKNKLIKDIFSFLDKCTTDLQRGFDIYLISVKKKFAEAFLTHLSSASTVENWQYFPALIKIDDSVLLFTDNNTNNNDDLSNPRLIDISESDINQIPFPKNETADFEYLEIIKVPQKNKSIPMPIYGEIIKNVGYKQCGSDFFYSMLEQYVISWRKILEKEQCNEFDQKIKKLVQTVWENDSFEGWQSELFKQCFKQCFDNEEEDDDEAKINPQDDEWLQELLNKLQPDDDDILEDEPQEEADNSFQFEKIEIVQLGKRKRNGEDNKDDLPLPSRKKQKIDPSNNFFQTSPPSNGSDYPTALKSNN